MTEAALSQPRAAVEDVIYPAVPGGHGTLEFRSTNTVHAPMMAALALIKRYKAEESNRIKCYALGEHVPVEGDRPG